MMKKIFGMVAIAVVALAATMNVRASLNGTAQLSDLQLENIEALDAGEGFGSTTSSPFPHMLLQGLGDCVGRDGDCHYY